jgi:1-acyl-sn-glycerol-3-phosphate acyltransferase
MNPILSSLPLPDLSDPGRAGSLGLRSDTCAGAPPASRPSERQPSKQPDISPLLLRWFTAYGRRYIRRHFHSLRVSQSGILSDAEGVPLVIYTNHASWWDPLIGLVLKQALLPDRRLFSPIDAAMLERYRLFAKLGFFGVQQQTRRGAVQFLRASEAILSEPDSLLALTPQGRFADARERPVRFQSGLGHLAARTTRAVFVPMATEFVFWEERLPEVLVRFGEPVEVRREHAAAFDSKYWTALFEQKLETAQDGLSLQAQRRDPKEFITCLRGEAGQGGVYDLWRATKARFFGAAFRKEHGNK